MAGRIDHYSVGEVARISGLTVRTLRHYDAIALLSPHRHGHAGYRRYSDADLERLQRICCYRELGFPLEEIATIVDDPAADPLHHLRRQHQTLTDRIDRLRAMVVAVEFAMEASMTGKSLTPQERFEVFGADDPAQYAEEVRSRWGAEGEYQEYQSRAGQYRKEDWQRIQAEANEINEAFASAKRGRVDAVAGPAVELAERHRRHIDRWYYACPHPMHRQLGEMYCADERFTRTYDAIEPGLAGYVRDAIVANADRAES